MVIGREPKAVLWVRRACIAILTVHMVFATWSLVRRIWQVFRIDLTASASTLHPGAGISYDVVTTGEVHNRIRLELVQGAHSEILAEEVSRVSAIATYDPRLFRYQRTMPVTAELLNRFTAGPATLRLTGFGSQKLLRTPPPRISELSVHLAAVVAAGK